LAPVLAGDLEGVEEVAPDLPRRLVVAGERPAADEVRLGQPDQGPLDPLRRPQLAVEAVPLPGIDVGGDRPECRSDAGALG
jgi:hypothetical protein